MLLKSSRLLNYPVLSLHVTGMIAKTTGIVIDPNYLKIEAFEVTGPETGREVGDYLRVTDIREFSSIGMVVDSSDEFVFSEDIIKLKQLLDINFSLIGKKVETKKGVKLGKVIDYFVNSDTFEVQQIIVQRPFLKAFLDSELTIGRSEIVKVTDTKVIVKEEKANLKSKVAAEDFVPNFVNPFREPQLSTADSRTLDEQDT